MADSATTETDLQPVTPAGRLFLQPLTDQIVNCAISCHQKFDIDTLRTQLKSSLFVTQPRFRSLLVRDSSGREFWRQTEVNVDQHLFIHHQPLPGDDPINEYIADLTVSSRLSTDKPLWEIHLLMAHNTAVVRLHHVLGDGISLVSGLLSFARRVEDPSKSLEIGQPVLEVQRKRWSVGILSKMVWHTLVYVFEYLLKVLWQKDETTVVSGGDGVELWPRKLATTRFRIDDMKIVKGAVSGATINDVLVGILSSGLSRYLELRSSEAIREGLQLTGVELKNLRRDAGLQSPSKLMNGNSGTRWGNQIGILLLPIIYHRCSSDPLQFVKRAKEMMDRKKLSLEALFSYKIGYLIMSVFGPKIASILNYRVLCNTTFTISNVMGPREEMTFAGNPVKHITTTSSSLPHAITMHMVSYAGEANLQILVAKDIIPDPKVLAHCLEDALHEMKSAAESVRNSGV